MRRFLLQCFATVALLAPPVTVAAQGQPTPSEAPEPKMPPMPSMEGQQGDVSKPVTQISPRKKVSPAAGVARVGAPGAKPAVKPRAAKARSSVHRKARPHPSRGRRRR